MAKKKRKDRTIPVVMRKTMEDEMRFMVKIDPMKVSIGHQSHVTGTGIHGDKRTKRHRTRSAQNRRMIGDWQ